MIYKRSNGLRFDSTGAYLVYLLVCCMIAFWPVSFGIFCLKNDATVYFLPVRFQISEMIRNGHFPFWTPYLQLGYPLYSDMQAGVWNPFVYIISLFGSYTMRSLQIEWLIYVYISGVSMFFLLRYFNITKRISLLVAASYMLCGFNLDSFQFGYWICGTAFLPSLFMFFHKMVHNRRWNDAVLFSIFLWLLFVCGYPAEFILISYLLLGYFIIFFIKIRNDKKILASSLKLIFGSFLLFVLLSLPAIISYITSLPYVTRGGKIDYELAITNKLHPVNLVSYFLPLTVWKLQPQITDLLGRNSYFGIIPLTLMISSFLTSQNNLARFFKWVFVVSLLFSLGDYGFVRAIAYKVLPLMNTFRHPSIARFLCIFSGCILSAFFLQKVINEPGKWIRYRRWSLGIIAGLIIITPFIFQLTGYAVSGKNFHLFGINTTIKHWLDQSSITDWLIADIAIQVIFLAVLYLYFVKEINVRILLVGSLVNVMLHAAILQPVTVVKNETVRAFETKIGLYKKSGFPPPVLEAGISANTSTDSSYQQAYGSINMFNKTIGAPSIFISPSPLKSYELLNADENIPFKNRLFNYPLLYKADTIVSSSGYLSTGNSTSRVAVISDEQLFKECHDFNQPGNYKATLTDFYPSKWKFEIYSESNAFFCIVQSYHPKWTLLVNGKNEELVPCNVSLMGFKLAKGHNIVELKFFDRPVIISLWVSVFTFLLLVFIGVRGIIHRKAQAGRHVSKEEENNLISG